MISRIVLNAFRFPLNPTSRFIQTSTRNYSRLGENGIKFAKDIAVGVRNAARNIKNRLFQPTTGKPFFYGNLAFAGSLILGSGAVMYYSFTSKESSFIKQYSNLSDTVYGNIVKTYTYFLATLALVAMVTFAASRSRIFTNPIKIRHLLSFSGILVVSILTHGLAAGFPCDFPLTKHSFWLIYCGTKGITLAFLLKLFLRSPVPLKSILGTAGIVTGLTALAAIAPSDLFQKLPKPTVSIVLPSVAVTGVVFLFNPSTAIGACIHSIFTYGARVMYSYCCFRASQSVLFKVIHHEKLSKINKKSKRWATFDPMATQMMLSACVFSLFIGMRMPINMEKITQMLTRFVFTATRLPLSSTVRCLQSSAKTTTSRFGGYAERASKFAEKMKEAGMRTWGPTIKERLLGPTTGKPFIYGSLALAAASGLGMGALMCYSLNKSDASIMQQSAAWSKSVRQNLANTYSYLFASFVITTAMAFLATRSPTLRHFSMKTGLTPFLTSFFLANGTLFVCLDISYDKTLAKHAAWLVNCGVMGAMILAPLCVFGGPVLMRAAWYTAGIVAGLSATAITAPSEKFLKWSAPLGMALGVVFMANVGCFWLPTTTALGANLASITVYGGLILFSMFLLQDTQLIIQYAVEYDKWVNQNRHMMEKMPSFDPINASIRIFVDVLNIYIRMTTITSDFKAIGTK